MRPIFSGCVALSVQRVSLEDESENTIHHAPKAAAIAATASDFKLFNLFS